MTTKKFWILLSTLPLTHFLAGVSLSPCAFAQAEGHNGMQQRSLGEICEEALAFKMVHSSIQSRLYHISKMKDPCKSTLLQKSLSATPGPAPSSVSPLANSLQVLQKKYSNWGIDPVYTHAWINLAQVKKTFKKKRDVVVAVIDTGIDPNHEYLKDNIYVSEGVKGINNYGRDFSVPSKGSSLNTGGRAPVDNHGHGTHVAGILKSVYPAVKILTIKYYNPSRSGQENLNSLIQSLEYAVKMGVDIINYSGGGPEPAIQELKILKEAERKGILVVAAAGNERSDIDLRNKAFYPASYGLDNIITVTAYDQQATILSSSNWGARSVDLAAPGHRIRSSVPHNRSHHMTGTSQATAFVSGVAAILKAQHPKLSAQDIKNIIRISAKKIAKLQKKCVTEGKLDASESLGRAGKFSKGESVADGQDQNPIPPSRALSPGRNSLCLGLSLPTRPPPAAGSRAGGRSPALLPGS